MIKLIPLIHLYVIKFCLLLPILVSAQPVDVINISAHAKQSWIQLDSTWRFKVGDNSDWSAPGFNDRSWQTIKLANNLDLSNVEDIPKQRSIIWFRTRITVDSALSREELVFRILQSGASEIYIDGELIHKLGVVSDDPDVAEFYNPNTKAVSFPVLSNDTMVLAVRFLNIPARLPIYSIYPKSFLKISVATLSYGVDDPVVQGRAIRFNRWNITLGVTVILCILYMTFFIFFPTQKINLYFSLSSLFHALFMATITYEQNYHGETFIVYFFQAVFQSPYIILTLYCFYKIFNLKLGFIYWAMQALAVIFIPLAFVFDSPVTGPLLGVVVLFETARIGVISVKTNKGAWIILIFGGLSAVYWAIVTLSRLSIIDIPNILSYLPFGFLFIPLSLAIYLGYSFGMISISLRKKLEEVEVLSGEKQKILSDQNIFLEEQVKERTSALNKSIVELKSTQALLIQTEKMASLGELTAGIAHEIQNPLNFVKNFSEVSNELMDEMTEEIGKGNTEEVKALAADVKQNLEKIVHHGKRADAIVKGMLQHSRSSSGTKEATNINALTDEYLKLAFHGLRAKDKAFNATMKTDYDESLEKINVIPQDIGRVILNIINNAFYAVTERKHSAGDAFEPTISVRTKKSDGQVLISITDNGNGIPQKVIDKIFQPFFTTKPTGEGTGLGLSLSYDIVKAHGGVLRVETKEGEGSEFIIQLPIV